MKKRTKKSLIIIICLFLIGVIIFSSYKIFNWFDENKKIEELEEEIIENTVIDEVVDNENTIIVEPEYEIDKEDPYWDYIKINLMDVNFKELKKTNKSTKGWLNVSGTNINYPFVQHTDNDFYLDHSFDKKYNSAGWVFVDYRNKLDGSDKNMIIYAHGRLDNSMFGSLRNIVKNSWYKDNDNHIVKISTETENTLWQVFSVYKIKTTNDYIQTEFFNDVEYVNFLEKLKKRSKFNFKTSVGINDQILTLSTCYDDDYKVVLHAKLIKREFKGQNNSNNQTDNTTNNQVNNSNQSSNNSVNNNNQTNENNSVNNENTVDKPVVDENTNSTPTTENETIENEQNTEINPEENNDENESTENNNSQDNELIETPENEVIPNSDSTVSN